MDAQLCYECGSPFEVDSTELVCDGCGLRVRNYSSQGVGHEGPPAYGTSDASAPITMRASGGPTVIICQVSPYKKTTRNHIVDEIKRLLESKQNIFPARVITDTADLFYHIQMHQTLRGDVRKGTIAACFFLTCRRLGMVQKNEFLAKLFGVHRNNLSNGNKIIESQVNCGLIDPLPSLDVRELMRNYLQQYFAGFGLVDSANSVRYFDFCLRVSYFCWRKNVGFASIPSSKCAGSLYLLAARVPDLIDLSRVKVVCECTPSTAKRFATAVELFLLRDPDDVAPEYRRGLDLTIRKLRHIIKDCGLSVTPLKQPRRARKK